MPPILSQRTYCFSNTLSIVNRKSITVDDVCVTPLYNELYYVELIHQADVRVKKLGKLWFWNRRKRVLLNVKNLTEIFLFCKKYLTLQDLIKWIALSYWYVLPRFIQDNENKINQSSGLMGKRTLFLTRPKTFIFTVNHCRNLHEITPQLLMLQLV